MPTNKPARQPAPDAKECQYLYQNAACGYMTIGRDNQGQDNQILAINATALAWLGYTRTNFVVPTPLSRLLDQTDIEALTRTIEQLQSQPSQSAPAQQVPVSLHARFRPSDGIRFRALVHVTLTWDTMPAPGGSAQVDLAVFNLRQFEDLVEALARSNVELKQQNTRSAWLLRRLAAVVNATPDAIISIDHHQVITFANPSATKMFRCERDDMIDEPLERFVPHRFRKAHGQHIKEFGKSGVTARQMAGSLTVMGLRADDTEFPLEASISQIEVDGHTAFTVMLRDVTLRAKVDDELTRVRERLRLLTARMRTVREDEQRHVARELHDDIGQRLSALRMDVAALRNELPPDNLKLFDLIESMDELVSSTVGAVRSLATGLRPKILDELGLAPALESFLQEVKTRFDLDGEIDIDDTINVSDDQSIEVFRIVQEAVHNVIKHSSAASVKVRFRTDGDHWRLTVRDDGRGMTQQDEEKEGSLGLIGIRERVDSLGGYMRIHSAPNQGTMIECRLPMTRAGEV